VQRFVSTPLQVVDIAKNKNQSFFTSTIDISGYVGDTGHMNKEQLKSEWPNLVQDGKPTEAFWTLWRANKEELKSHGVVVVKHDNGEYEAALLDKPAQKIAGAKLLTLSGVPTLAEFGAMTAEQKVAWVKSNTKTAKVLGLNLVKHEGSAQYNIAPWESVELAGVSELGLRESVCWWSRKQAGYAAYALKRLDAKPMTVNNSSTEKSMLDLWKQWQTLPLNEFKFLLVNEAKKGLKKYFSPSEVRAREARSEHNAMMQNDPSYAFEFIRSKIRGEYDALPEGASERDVQEARENDEANAAKEAQAE
jgi:hypothetical protein